ncbi:MAG TPA: ABC transporter permease [Pyrinomonadaceae bacterium]|nr:ABC transporter permease [Pyrinomonadaceae bacterium]
MDLTYSLRSLIRSPAFSLAVIVMLGIGIGANAAIFGVIDRLLLRPLPFNDQDRLVSIENAWPLFLDSAKDGEAIPQPDDAFEGLAKYETGRVTLGGQTTPEVIRLAQTSRNFFSVLGVGARVGSAFLPAHGQAQDGNVIVLSHGLWRRQFNEDRGVVGRQITLNGRSYTVIGVMPSDFLFLVRGRESDAWIPLVPDDSLIKSAQTEGGGTIARLKSGLSLAEAQARTDLSLERIMQARPQLKLRHQDRMLLVQLREFWFGNLRSPLLMLLGAAVCLLLIACANSLSLMIARAAERQKDMAIRAALGAGWTQMLRQRLIESLLLGLFGSLLGLAIAYWATKAMLTVNPVLVPHADEVGITLRSVVFAFAIAIPAAVIPALIAGWRISRTSLTAVINETSIRSGSFLSPRLRKILVVSEVALTMLVLINAGLLLRSFRGLLQEKLGFDTRNVLTLEIAPLEAKYPDRQKRSALYQQIISKVGSLPGVTSAGTINYLPIYSGSLIVPVSLQERVVPPEQGFSWTYRIASAEYFKTMAIPMVAGRSFNEQDSVDAPRVAILDQSAAAFLSQRFFPNEDIIGKHLVLNLDKPTAFEIVGIAGDIKQQGLDIPASPGFYLHALQRPPSVSNLVIRTASEPTSIAGVVRNAISEVDRDLPVSDLRLMENQVTETVSRRSFALFLTSILGVAALFLSMLGLYSLMSHIVFHRTHEIGVRMALGANVRDILKLILTQAFALVLIGIGLGIVISLATGRLIASLLFGVSTTDPATLVGVTVILVLVAIVACYMPARRAMKIDPIEALRYE